jgi:hypothetical protein
MRIGDRLPFRIFAKNSWPCNFRLLQQYRPFSDLLVSGPERPLSGVKPTKFAQTWDSLFLTQTGHLRLERPSCFLISRRRCPPVPKSQKIVNLALSPAMILSRERIDAGIDADVANKEIRTLDKVSNLVDSSPAETTCASSHYPAPSLPYAILCSGVHPQVA